MRMVGIVRRTFFSFFVPLPLTHKENSDWNCNNRNLAAGFTQFGTIILLLIILLLLLSLVSQLPLLVFFWREKKGALREG